MILNLPSDKYKCSKYNYIWLTMDRKLEERPTSGKKERPTSGKKLEERPILGKNDDNLLAIKNKFKFTSESPSLIVFNENGYFYNLNKVFSDIFDDDYYDQLIEAEGWSFEEIVARLYSISEKEIFRCEKCCSFQLFGKYKGEYFEMYNLINDLEIYRSICINGSDDLDVINLCKDLLILLKNIVPKEFKKSLKEEDIKWSEEVKIREEKSFIKSLDYLHNKQYAKVANQNWYNASPHKIIGHTIEMGDTKAFICLAKRANMNIYRIINLYIIQNDMKKLKFIAKYFEKINGKFHKIILDNFRDEDEEYIKIRKIFMKEILLHRIEKISYVTNHKKEKGSDLDYTFIFLQFWENLDSNDHLSIYIHNPRLYENKPFEGFIRYFVDSISAKFRQYYPKELTNLIIKYI